MEENENQGSDGRFYISNKALYDEMVKWRDSSPDVKTRVISEELGRMVREIATRLTGHTNFRNYPYDLKQEMISNACCKVLFGLKNYNFKYMNPFGYITRACWNANINVCIKYYKAKNLPRELIKENLEQLDGITEIDATAIRRTLRELLDYEPGTKEDEDHDSPIVTPPKPEHPTVPRKGRKCQDPGKN